MYIPQCPGCDRPLKRTSDVLTSQFSQQRLYYLGTIAPEKFGDWVCLKCPRYDYVDDRFFSSFNMPHPPGTPDETIMRDIRTNLNNSLKAARGMSMFPDWATCAVAYLLNKLEKGENK